MAVRLNRVFPIRAIGPSMCLVERDRFVAVLEASPINFGLRAPADQGRLVQSYVAFLNGLSFPVELLVQSDWLRLDDYLGELKSHEDDIESHLRPSLTDYVEFIHRSVSSQHLLRRRFYVVLSWRGSETRSRPVRRGEVLWEEAEQQLKRRRETVEQGLRPLGIRIRDLDAESMFRFLYASLGGGAELPKGVNWAWD